MSETAYRYAAALRRTDCRADVFLTSARAIPAQGELWQVMIDPSIGLREKHAVLDRLPELKEQPMLRNFYKLLVDKHRFSMLPEIADAYHDILLHERGESVCTLRCVRVPDDQRLSAIARTSRHTCPGRAVAGDDRPVDRTARKTCGFGPLTRTQRAAHAAKFL